MSIILNDEPLETLPFKTRGTPEVPSAIRDESSNRGVGSVTVTEERV